MHECEGGERESRQAESVHVLCDSLARVGLGLGRRKLGLVTCLQPDDKARRCDLRRSRVHGEHVDVCAVLCAAGWATIGMVSALHGCAMRMAQ
eukprot:337604-Prymnesium_polylepis.2